MLNKKVLEKVNDLRTGETYQVELDDMSSALNVLEYVLGEMHWRFSQGSYTGRVIQVGGVVTLTIERKI